MFVRVQTQPLHMDTEILLDDTLELLRPKLVRFKTMQEASDAVKVITCVSLYHLSG